MPRPRIGLLGCGNIGRIIARRGAGLNVVAVYDRHPERARQVGDALGARVHSGIDAFVADDFEVLVEAASVAAVSEVAARALGHGKDLVVLSAGALGEVAFRQELEALARERGRRIRIPSGALFGLDNLKVAQISRLERITLHTTKHPRALGVEAHERTRLFCGSAPQCIAQFPRNANVAVALGIATGTEIEVEIWADPEARENVHMVYATGEFGEVQIQVSNLPSPENPATSYLAALSAITLLKALDAPLVVGT
ncbi:MAG: aspartate dehydrogenase [Pseudomonadota bacterium]|nr:MAG: aspartate dehydrogenase [Pseudomonadota bacterium]